MIQKGCDMISVVVYFTTTDPSPETTVNKQALKHLKLVPSCLHACFTKSTSDDMDMTDTEKDLFYMGTHDAPDQKHSVHRRKLDSTGPTVPNASQVIDASFGTANGTQVSPQEKETACKADNSLCFGEVLPSGVTKMMDKEHLYIENATILVDTGMGIGKLIMQAFLEYPNLLQVRGVEFCESRAETARNGLSELYNVLQDSQREDVSWTLDINGNTNGTLAENRMILPSIRKKRSKNSSYKRVLEFCQGDLFHSQHMFESADIIICETKIRSRRYAELRKLLGCMKVGSRLLMYENLACVYGNHGQEGGQATTTTTHIQENLDCPFQQLDVNISIDDRFLTTWSPTYGHHFYMYKKVK